MDALSIRRKACDRTLGDLVEKEKREICKIRWQESDLLSKLREWSHEGKHAIPPPPGYPASVSWSASEEGAHVAGGASSRPGDDTEERSRVSKIPRL